MVVLFVLFFSVDVNESQIQNLIRREYIMQYDVKTPGEYIEALDDDWRRQHLESIRTIIKTKAPHFEEGIDYKMLSYGDDKGIVFYLNAQKNHVGLYVGDAGKIDHDGSLLKGLNAGKGCIRFTKSIVIANTRIDQFIERTVELWHQGADIAC